MITSLRAILWKDLKIEIRTKEAFSASFVFSVLVLVIFNFTMDMFPDEALRFGAALLWIAFVFSGFLSLNRSFALEREDGAMQGLAVAPIDGSAVFLGKFIANVLFMLTTEAIVLPLFAMFFNVSITTHLPALIASVVLGTIGFAAVGTLFAAIAVHTRMREVLLPVLMLPITIPVLIAAVETTSYALGAQEAVSFWFKLLVVYDIVFVTASLLVFDYILQE